jgi:serine/threonine protein kinase
MACLSILCDTTLSCSAGLAPRVSVTQVEYKTSCVPASLLILRKVSPPTSSTRLETGRMTTAVPFSPPFAGEDWTRNYCFVEVDGQPKQASWRRERGEAFPPDFTDTGPVLDVVIHDLQFSDTKSDLWQNSTLLDYGSDACVRLEGEGGSEHPLIKLAHPGTERRERIQHEFEVMQRLSHLGFVARIDTEPLRDYKGVFGFRLERLVKVDRQDTSARKGEIVTMLHQLHQAGYCHGDIHFCNIMKRSDGELVLIDFAYAGALGEAVPDRVPEYMHPGRVYSVEFDLERLQGQWI